MISRVADYYSRVAYKTSRVEGDYLWGYYKSSRVADIDSRGYVKSSGDADDGFGDDGDMSGDEGDGEREGSGKLKVEIGKMENHGHGGHREARRNYFNFNSCHLPSKDEETFI
jgi:hypothetical protein